MKKRGPLLLFYLLVAYIIAQFCWWAYHIYDLSGEIHRLQLQLQLSENSTGETKSALDAALQRRFWMVFGEGAVFLLLLLLGAWKTGKAFRKEVALNEQQRNFLLSITHELKSPIAAARLNLETLLKRNLPEEKRTQLAASAITEADRLTTLVDNMLIAARIDSGSYQFFTSRLDLGALAEKLVAARFASGGNVTMNIEEEQWIHADEMAVSIILSNLLDNAAKYSPKGSEIAVSVSRQRDEVLLTVKDNGPGIPDREKKNIFRKFYRIGNEETRSAKGTGLGLYIASYLARQHQASLSVKDNPAGGSIFELRFKEHRDG